VFDIILSFGQEVEIILAFLLNLSMIADKFQNKMVILPSTMYPFVFTAFNFMTNICNLMHTM